MITLTDPADFVQDFALEYGFSAADPLAEANIPETALELSFAGSAPGDLVTVGLSDSAGSLGSLSFAPSDGLTAIASAGPFTGVTIAVQGSASGELIGLGRAGASGPATPEPASAALLAVGLAVIYLGRKIRTDRAARGAIQRAARPTVAPTRPRPAGQ